MTHTISSRQESKFVKTIRKHNDIFIGVDVHKKKYVASAYSIEFGSLKTISMEAEPAVLVRVLKKCGEAIRRVVYEAGPSGYSLVRALREAGLRADVVATSSIPRPSTKKSKNDFIDSRKLAEYAAKDILEYVRVPTTKQERERAILRVRGQARKDLTRTMNRIKMFLQMYGIEEPEGLGYWSVKSVNTLRKMKLPADLRAALDSLLADYDHFKKQVSNRERALKRVMRRKHHADACDRLTSIPGVGPLTAATFLLEVYSPDRFPSAREIGQYCGLAPCENQSGDHRPDGELTDGGNRRLRHILVEAAQRWILEDPWASYRFGQYMRNTGRKQKAVVAMARKLAIVMRKLVLGGERYKRPPLPAEIAAEPADAPSSSSSKVSGGAAPGTSPPSPSALEGRFAPGGATDGDGDEVPGASAGRLSRTSKNGSRSGSRREKK
jgi:transposase